MTKLLFCLTCLLAACISACTPAYALDGFASVETDMKAGSPITPDFQAQIGQRIYTDYRVYANMEETRADNGLPNSPQNYRLGLELNRYAKNGLKLELMLCRYQKDNNFVGTKATWAFDTAQ